MKQHTTCTTYKNIPFEVDYIYHKAELQQQFYPGTNAEVDLLAIRVSLSDYNIGDLLSHDSIEDIEAKVLAEHEAALIQDKLQAQLDDEGFYIL